MELFSQKFFPAARAALDSPDLVVLGTIPVPKDGHVLPEVAEVSGRQDVEVITVTRDNRDQLVSLVWDKLRELMQQRGRGPAAAAASAPAVARAAGQAAAVLPPPVDAAAASTAGMGVRASAQGAESSPGECGTSMSWREACSREGGNWGSGGEALQRAGPPTVTRAAAAAQAGSYAGRNRDAPIAAAAAAEAAAAAAIGPRPAATAAAAAAKAAATGLGDLRTRPGSGRVGGAGTGLGAASAALRGSDAPARSSRGWAQLGGSPSSVSYVRSPR